MVPALFARPAWSPDGRRIAFAAGSGTKADIYVTDVGGGHQRRVTRLGDAFEPLWSPDGGTIIFTRRRLARDGLNGALWRIALRGTKARELTQRRKGRLDIARAFSPDGQTMLFTRRTCVSRRRDECFYKPATTTTIAIYAARPDGSRARRLVRSGSEPAFSPTGLKIAFGSGRDRNGLFTYGEVESFADEIYVANADGTHQRRLTHTRLLNEGSPSWRDERRIAFQSGEEIGNAEGTRLLEVNTDGTCRRTILGDPKLDTWYARPAWQPIQAGGGAAPTSC